MRWEDYRQSDNVEDRRGMGGGFGGGGGGFRVPIGGGGLGIGGVVVLGLLALFFGIDPRVILSGGDGYVPTEQQAAPRSRPAPGNDQEARFVRAVLAQTEDVWGRIFQNAGRTYQQPRLVLYDRATSTACGTGQAAMGPFYCPADQRVYLDTSFFDELGRRFGAPGDFAIAYVIAHEIGHHVQHSLGLLGGGQRSNAQSVRTELQADCFAGIFAHFARDELRVLQTGDIEEGIRAASAVGDDTLQRRSQGRVVPDSFTHGSSAQRVQWFRRGLESGRPADCDTSRG